MCALNNISHTANVNIHYSSVFLYFHIIKIITEVILTSSFQHIWQITQCNESLVKNRKVIGKNE